MEINYPFVSIVIPARNSENIIGRCLESLNILEYPKDKYEVIIADGNSEDGTTTIAQKLGAIVVSNPKRIVCTGRNEGFKHAKGEIIAFSDADCVMDKNWIKNSIKYFEDPTIGGVGGPNITPDNETAFGKAVGFVFNQAIFSAGGIHARILKRKKEVKSIPGCNAIYRRNALEKVMPIDENIVEAEDYIMNQKIRNSGYKLIYTPDTIVWHYRRPIPKKFFKQIYRYAIGRLLIGKENKENINLMHIAVGFGLPILLLASVFLLSIDYIWLVAFAAVIILFLIAYFLAALVKLKSLKAATFVPLVIIILFSAWSMGFLKELISPIKSRA